MISINNQLKISELSDQDFFQLALEKFKISEQGKRRRFKYRISNIDITRFHETCGNLKSKKILSVSGSAMQLFNLLSDEKQMPEYIYGFDYSPKQVAYNYLLKYAIKYLSFAEFCDFFGICRKNIKRTRKNRERRLMLIKKIPPDLREYLSYNHEITKRDLLLKSVIDIPFLEERNRYEVVRKNVDRTKFFIYNLNTSLSVKLEVLFPSAFFNFIYLSNALDWIYWHNQEGTFSVNEIIDNIAKVSHFQSVLLIDHLASRKTKLVDYLKKREIIGKVDYRAYKYCWRMYKLLINK